MRIVITAGATRERIDDVRFISNRSTGKMGYALAQAAKDAGHEVTLISGVSALPKVEGVSMEYIESAAELAESVKRHFVQADILIMAAAVADYRPKQFVAGKIKKKAGDMTLELERTEDILLSVSQLKHPHQTVVGFAAEAVDIESNALGKLNRKKLDWICANDITREQCGFGVDTNCITLYGINGKKIELPFGSKTALATEIIKQITGDEK